MCVTAEVKKIQLTFRRSLQLFTLYNFPWPVPKNVDSLNFYLREGRDETAQAYNTAISKEFGNLSHPSNVLLTILLSESQVLVQTSSYVVTIEAVCWDTWEKKYSWTSMLILCDNFELKINNVSLSTCFFPKVVVKEVPIREMELHKDISCIIL